MASDAKRPCLVKDFRCSACKEKTVESLAEIYCQACDKFYCGECTKLHVQLFTKHVTYGRTDMQEWPIPKEVKDFVMKCEEHPDNKIEVVCRDHDQLCCSTCRRLSHR